MTQPRKRRPRPVAIQRGQFGVLNLGAARFDWHDPYHMVVSLSWPAFVAVLLASWLSINLLFALLYVLSPGDIANARPGNFADAFFFSVETLATVGYGVMAPVTTYGHIVSATEIVNGTAFTAIVTGLLFVRFSRPKARIVYAIDAVVTTHNARQTLMVRAANGRMTLMTSAKARLFALVGERTKEGGFLRRIHDLTLIQSQLPLFVVPWVLMHAIDEGSPLYGLEGDEMVQSDVRLFLTIEAQDQALGATVHDMKYYEAAHIRPGMRYVDAVSFDEAGRATVDLSRISLIEPEEAFVRPEVVPTWARWAR
jgi:inward rectifier potassium channel